MAAIVRRGDDGAKTTWGRSAGRKNGAHRIRKTGAKLLAVAARTRSEAFQFYHLMSGIGAGLWGGAGFHLVGI